MSLFCLFASSYLGTSAPAWSLSEGSTGQTGPGTRGPCRRCEHLGHRDQALQPQDLGGGGCLFG